MPSLSSLSSLSSLAASAVVGAAIGALGITWIVRRNLPAIVEAYRSHLTEHERDMAKYYASLAYDKLVLPCRLRDTTITTLCGYDPSNTASLNNFTRLKKQVDCVFAKTARVWGAAPWDERLSLEDNVKQSLPAFTLFMSTQRGLDAFVFEVPTPDAGDTVEHFGETVRRIMKTLSDCDPDGWHCMNKSFIADKAWVFRFNKEEAFVTSFAPCYPETHSRFNFGETSSYILFQPYSSFLTHNVGSDTPHTNWDKPKTMRDRVRCNFFNHGRPYLIREVVAFPIVEDIVKPLGLNDPPIPWYHAPKAGAAACPFLAGNGTSGAASVI